jgi:hypothetical protein
LKKLALVLFASLAPISVVQAQNMPLSQFLTKANALEKKGAMALFSGDMGLLKKEMAASAKALRAERLAAQQAGRKPAFCPPEKQTGMAVTEILSHFRAIPAAQRDRMRTKDGFRSLLATKYPCPA